MKVKLCGLTTTGQIRAAYELGVDYAGLDLYEGSARSALPLAETDGEEIVGLEADKVGIFVNQPVEEILRMVEHLNLTSVQLHGDETPEFCRSLRDRVNVIKAFRIDRDTDIDDLVQPYHDACNYYVFVTLRQEDGTHFNWTRLERSLIDKLFFLSGDIGPGDTERLREFYHPFHYGIDVNSRFETAPGVKDMEAVGRFLSDLNASEPDRLANAEQSEE